jgi:hypothetical protein
MKAAKSRRALGLGALIAAIATIAALLVSGAAGEVVKAGNLVVTIEGGITPKKLPKKAPAPITLKVKGKIATSDGSHVPVLKTVDLQFDRHGSLNTKGLPTCKPSQLQSTLTAQAKKACGDALVGTGRVSAEIAFPEQPPFNASGPLLIFNGPPQGHKQTLVFHVYAHVPAPTTFVTTGLISKSGGKYGTEALIQIPTIVGGQGSLTSFEATLHKTWTYKHQKQSLLLASCPTGALYAHGDFAFATGTTLSGNIVRPCTPGS